MSRSGAYFDPRYGLTRYGRTKHEVRDGLWSERGGNVAKCDGRALPRPVHTYRATFEFPVCRRCQASE